MLGTYVYKYQKGVYLVILAAGTKAKNEQVSMGICGSKVLSIWTTFAVKQCSMALALNLSRQKERQREERKYVHTVNHIITPPVESPRKCASYMTQSTPQVRGTTHTSKMTSTTTRQHIICKNGDFIKKKSTKQNPNSSDSQVLLLV